MKFTVLTLFPDAFSSYLSSSMLKRAINKKLIKVEIIDIRKFTKDKRKTADDKPYGGGPGMVMKAVPILRAVNFVSKGIKDKTKSEIVIFSASAKILDSAYVRKANKKFKNIILIAGHYEGIDHRVKNILKRDGFKIRELSIGPYVLSGGELPAMVLIDSVSRHIPGFLGNEYSLEEKRGALGMRIYTRPEEILWPEKKKRGVIQKEYKVPRVLLSGDHKKIAEWRKKHLT